MRRLCLPLLVLPCLGAGQQEWDAHEVPVDREHELPSAPAGPLPVLGPRRAPVTIDLSQPLGAPATPAMVALALRLVREARDVRLVYHPVPTSPNAERGEEALWEALAQGRFWALCEHLHARPDVLAPDREPALLEEAGRLGLDRQRLREALGGHRHRARVQELWRRDQESSLPGAELRVNGRRLPAPVTETQLRDEIERQRERAQALVREGVPLSLVYDRLVQQERARVQSWPPRFERPAGRPPSPARAHVDTADAPVRGPAVAPVLLVLFVSVDTYSSAGYGELVRAVMEQHPGQLRLIVRPLPTPGSSAGQMTAWYLDALARRSPADFWRGYDALVQASRRRFQLGAREVRDALQLGRVDLTDVPPLPGGGPVRKRMEADAAQAKRLGIDGPPALLVNGLLLRGTLTLESLDEAVRRELDLGLIGRLREGAPTDN